MSSFKIFCVKKHILFVVICVTFVLVLCLILPIFLNNKDHFPTRFYYLCIDGLENKTSADVARGDVCAMGASGKIIAKENCFCVLLFVYEKRSSAENIAKELDLPNLKLESFEIEQLTYKTKKKVARSVENDGIKLFKKTFEKLYDIVCEFDKNKISESNVFFELNKIANQLGRFCKKCTSETGCSLFCEFKEEISLFFEGNDNKNEISSSLKTLCFDCLFFYNEYVEILNSAN